MKKFVLLVLLACLPVWLVIVYPVDKWVLMMMKAIGAKNVRNLGDVRWCATEDGSQGKGTGRHIAAFVLGPNAGVKRHMGRAQQCYKIMSVAGCGPYVRLND